MALTQAPVLISQSGVSIAGLAQSIVTITQCSFTSIGTSTSVIDWKVFNVSAVSYISQYSLNGSSAFLGMRANSGIRLIEDLIIVDQDIQASTSISDVLFSNSTQSSALVIERTRFSAQKEITALIQVLNVSVANSSAELNQAIIDVKQSSIKGKALFNRFQGSNISFSSIDGAAISLHAADFEAANNSMSFHIDNMTLTNCSATKVPGLVIVSLKSISQIPAVNSFATAVFNLTNSRFSGNLGSVATSGLFIDDDSQILLHVALSNCKFFNNQGSLTNEIYFKSIKSVDLNRINWSSSYQRLQQEARFLSRKSPFSVTLTNSVFNCAESQTGINNVTLLSDPTWLLDRASLITLSTAAGNSLTDSFAKNIYFKCQEAYKGGVFNVQGGTVVVDTGSIYNSSSAFYGGLIYAQGLGTKFSLISPQSQVSENAAHFGAIAYAIEGASVIISNAIITKNQAIEGGIAYLTDSSFLSLGPSVTALLNSVFKRGLIVAYQGSTFNITGAKVLQNTANEESVFIYASNVRNQVVRAEGSTQSNLKGSSSPLWSTVTDCIVSQNQVNLGGRLITVLDGNLKIVNTNFTQSYIDQDTLGIFTSMSSIVIEGCTFQNLQSQDSFYTAQVNKQLGDINGGFISVGINSSMTITNSVFSGARGASGGCISIQGPSSLMIAFSSFVSCSAIQGGAIYASNFNSLVITNSTFSRNVAFSGFSQNVYCQGAKHNITFSFNTFYSYHNSVYLNKAQLLVLTGNSFLHEANRLPYLSELEYAGGLHIINTQSIVSNGDLNTFIGLQGKNGGAIYIECDNNLKVANTNIQYELGYFSIKSCQASKDGGAIYLLNPGRVTLSQSVITGNKAINGDGGAIVFLCNKNLSTVPSCSLALSGTSINGNAAQVGGGIRWNWARPTLDSVSAVTSNTALEYGSNFASFAREIVMLQDEKTYLTYFNKQQNFSTAQLNFTGAFTNYTYESVQSGGFIPTQYYALVDEYQQVVTINSGQTIQFTAVPQTIGGFTTVVSGVNKFFSTYGVFNVSGMQLVSAPNSTQYINLNVLDAVDITYPVVSEYLQQAFGNISNYSIQITLNVRPCRQGEGMQADGSCFKCGPGTYLLVSPEPGVPTQCKACPQEAKCLGGTQIGPLPGYWRKNNYTDDFLKCQVSEACLGMIEPNMISEGECSEGYHGALCASCKPGYARQDKYGCNDCPNPLLNGLRIIGVLIALVIVIGFLVRSTMQGAARKNLQSVYLKIMTNHLQLLSICASFNFKWPDNVNSLFSIGNAIMGTTDIIFSFDCQLDTRLNDSIDIYQYEAGKSEFRIYYMKLIMMGGLPVLIAVFTTIFWWGGKDLQMTILVLKYQGKLNEIETKLIATLVIIFFLVHPKITQTMIQMFNCQYFSGDLRLMGDLQVICGEGLYDTITLGVALPCLIAWGIGIPAGVWIMMRSSRDRLDTMAVKEKFGFLYNGYKRSSYFWEIVIMYRKILLIGISVFMNRIGIIVQALVLLIFLIAFLQLNNMRRPFASRDLNDIEDVSMIAGIITIYCGIFFITNKDPASPYYDSAQDFSLPNWGSLLIFGIIVLANVAFLLTWLVKFIAIIRTFIKERYSKIYLCLFLCCREDKLAKETEDLAKESKRENIIEKIEEVQFFFKNMKKLYERSSSYEGHSRFLKVLYFIESEKHQIDLTEKKNNYQVSGKMARERKLDPERMKKILEEHVLDIDLDLSEEKQNSNNQKCLKIVKIGAESNENKSLNNAHGPEFDNTSFQDETRLKDYSREDLLEERSFFFQGDSDIDTQYRNPQSQVSAPVSVFEDFIPSDLKRRADIIRQQEQDQSEEGIRSRNALDQLKRHRKKRPKEEEENKEGAINGIQKAQSGDQPKIMAALNEFYDYADFEIDTVADQSVKMKRMSRGLSSRMQDLEKSNRLTSRVMKMMDQKDAVDIVLTHKQEEEKKESKEQRIFRAGEEQRDTTHAFNFGARIAAIKRAAKVGNFVLDESQMPPQSGVAKQEPRIGEEEFAISSKLVSVAEAIELTKRGKEWRKDIKHGEKRLRDIPVKVEDAEEAMLSINLDDM